MKIFAVILVLALPVFASSPRPVPSYSIITADDARKHLSMLAADSMQGRNTPSPQLEIAAKYIADRFKEYGLKPVNGSYFQRYAISRTNLGTGNVFVISHDSSWNTTSFEKESKGLVKRTTTIHLKVLMEIKTDWVPYDFSAGTADSGGIVFAGYGITAPEFKYDDYAGIDVKGKFVLVLKHEPDEKGTDTTFFRGPKWTRYAEVRSKMKNARAHGAIGVIAVTDPGNHILLKPQGYAWPSLFDSNMHGDQLPVELEDGPSDKILAVHAGESTMALLFGSIDSLKRVQKLIDSTHTPHSFALNDKVEMKVDLEKTRETVPNVVGWWQGDRTDSQHIVIGAHMDHIGVRRTDSTGQDTIFNGADDNASGTTGVLEVARAFCAASDKPHRSILFMTFSGEEKGLYGSRAYVAYPLVSLDQCAAMLNMDMIGRNDPDSLQLGGAGHSPDLTDIAVEQNKDIGLKIKLDDDYTGRSDQASFAEHKIPVLFFFTGEHEDYHKVGDSVNKINFDKLARIAKLCFRTAWTMGELETWFLYK